MAVISRDSAEYFKTNGAPLEKTPQTVAWDPISAAKGGYRAFHAERESTSSRARLQILSGDA